MTYTQMKMLIEFIKLCVATRYRTVGDEYPQNCNRRDDLEKRLLMSCGYERKF